MRRRNKSGTETVGDFDVQSGKLVVSDPCYDRGTWCAGVLENVKNGKWTAEVEYSDEGDWGSRVKELRAYADGYRDHYAYKRVNFEIGVDSGQVCLSDESVYPRGETGEYGELDTFYGRACEANGSVAGSGIFEDGRAVVSSSGFGDGSYDGYTVTNERGEIVGVRVVFIDEDDEEHDEEYDDSEEDYTDDEEEDDEV